MNFFNKIKLTQLILTVYFFFPFIGVFAICEVPSYIPPPVYDTDEIYLLNDADFITYFDAGSEFYATRCGTTVANLKYNRTKGTLSALRISVEVWKESFDCSGNLLGDHTYVMSTPLQTFTGSPSSQINIPFDIDVLPNTSYTIKLKIKKRTLGVWSPFHYSWLNNFRFVIPPTSQSPNPNGVFNDLLNVEPRTSAGMGWTVDVHQLDASGTFDFDATSTGCEDHYRYEIAEFDLDTWNQSNVVATGWIPGEAGIIDMDAFYTYGFDIGKLYKLKLIVGSGWYSKDYWFEIKSPQIVGTISHLNAYATPILDIFGNTTYFTYYEVCNNTPVYLYTDGTESYDQYRITIEELDTYYNPTGSSETTLWQTGIVPSTYNVNALWGGAFNTSRRYKVIYEIRNPLLRKEFYIKPVSCPGIGRGDSGNSGNNRGKSLEITNSISELKKSMSTYPNPTKGAFKVAFENDEAQEVMIEIINLEGKVIYQKKSTDTQFEFDLTEYPNGIYLIKINTNNEILLEKVIKR